ncbi:MAG: hypothetical protein H7320_13720 [Ferruginibacter sp.]|nr:hypothetical protein [Ferruginibacter sp.]
MKEILKENILANEKQLWEQALFIFDSSALLNFYEYSEKTRQEIFGAAFKILTNRLWITNHTEYEYLKNRERVLLRPKKLYDDLTTNYFDIKQFETFQIQFSQLQNRTKKDDKHPHIEEAFFQKFETRLQLFGEELQNFWTELKERIENKKAEIDAIKESDSLKTAVYQYFQITESYSFDKLIEIAKEGEFRYKNQIPPGYQDVKEKIGLAIYGDLVIWNQILDLAKKEKKPIILIIDDLKIDWCYQNSKDKNIADSPREELIKEFTDSVGHAFWLYSSTQFLQKSTQYLATVIADEVIEEVNQSNQFNSEYKGGPYLEVDFVWKSSSRVPQGYSDKNPTEMHDGRPVILVGNEPIIYWAISRNFSIAIYNNSNHPAFNITLETVGAADFLQIDNLPKINNLPPLQHIELKAKYEDFVEGVYTAADKIMNAKIPEKFKEIKLKLTYYDEARKVHTNYVEFVNDEIINIKT